MGSETPRLFSPPARELVDDVLDSFGRIVTPATTRGYECIRFAEDVMGVELLPWQKWLLVHALELNPDGTFRFRIIVLLVARQNGKSTLMQVLTLWRMYVDGAPLVLGTAQTLDIAEKQWADVVDVVEAIPELQAEVAKVNLTNGKKSLRLESKQEYAVKAATRRGARGLSGDLVLLDELREHQNWDAWASVTKTTMARPFAQIWGASNAGDHASVVLRYLRALGHQQLGFPDGRDEVAEGLTLLEAYANGEDVDEPDDAAEAALSSLGIFEWSAEPGASVWDRDGWAASNPSLGYTIREQDLATAAATDPEHVFRTECLCQFVAAASTGPFPAGSWAAVADSKAERAARGVERDMTRPVTYCVDVSWSRLMTYVAVAYWDTEGLIRVQVVAQRAGTDWLIPWLTSDERLWPVEHLTLQTRGAPVSSLLPALEAIEDITITPWEGSLLSSWYGVFFDRVAASVTPDDELIMITHASQPLLEKAALSAVTKKSGDGLMIDRSASPQDAAPLCAAIGAVGLLESNPAPAIRSVYEDRGLLVV